MNNKLMALAAELGVERLPYAVWKNQQDIDLRVSNDRKMWMTISNFSSIPQGEKALDEWVKGMEFMRDIQGFEIVWDKTDETTKLYRNAWVGRLFKAYSDARDKVFFVIKSPFKQLDGDIQGVCLVSAFGTLVSVSELTTQVGITTEVFQDILSGEAWKSPAI